MGPIDDYFSPTYEIIKRLREPQKLYISSGVLPDGVFDKVIMEAKERLEKEGCITQYQVYEMLGFPVCKSYIEGIPYMKWEIKTEKETKKMEAKKCDRCGKLYEMPGACENPNGANVRFKFEKVYRAEEKSGTKIAEEQSKDIYIKSGLTSSDHYVDFCPDCRASLKKWFENPEKEGK